MAGGGASNSLHGGGSPKASKAPKAATGGQKKPSTAPGAGREKRDGGGGLLNSSGQMTASERIGHRIGQLVLGSTEAELKKAEALKIAGQRRAPGRKEMSAIEKDAADTGAVPSPGLLASQSMEELSRSQKLDPMRRPGPGGGGNPTHGALVWGPDFAQTWGPSSPKLTQTSWAAGTLTTSWTDASHRSSSTGRNQRRTHSRPGQFRQMGLGIGSKESTFLNANRGSAEGLGPGEYTTTVTGDTCLWRQDLPSNKVQQYLSQHKSPKLCSFTSGTHNNRRGLGFHEVPGPGHYSLPGLWSLEPEKAPGTVFGLRKNVDRREVESRFGRDVKAAKDLQ